MRARFLFELWAHASAFYSGMLTFGKRYKVELDCVGIGNKFPDHFC